MDISLGLVNVALNEPLLRGENRSDFFYDGRLLPGLNGCKLVNDGRFSGMVLRRKLSLQRVKDRAGCLSWVVSGQRVGGPQCDGKRRIV